MKRESKNELATQKVDLARAIIERAFEHLARLEVDVTMRVGHVWATLAPEAFCYKHPDYHQRPRTNVRTAGRPVVEGTGADGR